MPRLLERFDGSVVEVPTAEEQAAQDARVAASEKAHKASVATEPTWLAGISTTRARTIVDALANATYGDPMIASRVYEVLRHFGLSPSGSWPDSTSQPR